MPAFVIGLVIVMFGVGGIENSVANTDLALSVAVAVAGILLMQRGVVKMQQN
jgi:uncharacterized membrane protein YdcZ (DUF606 family)